MEYDLIFRDLKIVDGTGIPYFYGDIGVKDDYIKRIGKIHGQGERELDCKGLIASPGFIDIHSHGEFSIMKEPTALCYISQGVTSFVVGNCGETLAPVNELNFELYGDNLMDSFGIRNITYKEYLDRMQQLKKSINIIPLVGNGNLRSYVVGCTDVVLTEENTEDIKNLLEEAMALGAFGLSTGLIYSPDIFMSPDEIVELAKIVKNHDGIYATHMRSESDLVIDAMMEAITVAKKTGVRLEIAHLKASGKQNFGLSKTMIGLIDSYRKQGLNIGGDAYPFIYCRTSLQSCIPPWVRKEGSEHFLELLNDAETRKNITKQLKLPGIDWENMIFDAGLDDILLSDTTHAPFEKYINKSIFEISVDLAMDPYETVYHLLINDKGIGIIAGGVSEDDNIEFIKSDLVGICSDGTVSSIELGNTHPRSYSTFTKILESFVRERKLMSMEKAVMKMTIMPARKLGIKDRGLLLEGFKADIAIFNNYNLKAHSTFEKPHAISSGMEYVLVNGKIVFEEGQATNVYSGELLRKKT
jgi:N-acyl-D-aspartate/D-glutamate deacylase